MKKILFIAYNCPPVGGGGVLRTAKFLKFLQHFGWNPIVVTAKPAKVSNFDSKLLKEIPSNVLLYRVRGIAPFFLLRTLKKIGLSVIRQWLERYCFIPDKMAGWVSFAYRASSKLIITHSCKVIYTTSPPHSTHLIGLRLKKQFPHIPWVADFRDAWCENPFRQFPRDSHRYMREEKMEQAVFASADVLIFNTVSCRDVYIKKYQSLIGKKSYVIPNGFDQSDFDSLISQKEPLFTVLHAGSLYGIRSLQPLLDGLEHFCETYPDYRNKMRVVFLGHLVVEKEKERIASSKVADMFVYQDFVPHQEALQKMKNADLLLLITGKNETDIMIPCKFYEYMGARVPILALTDKGELSAILTEARLGKWFDGNNPAEISVFLYELIQNRTHLSRSKINEEIISRYDRRFQTGQLAEILNALVK